MKYILDSPETTNQLRNANCGNWILAGFFIHGRGTTIQKSFDGLLYSLLYNILRQVDDLSSVIHPLYVTEVKSCGWTTRTLQKALRNIIKQRTVKFSLLLLVDALDEFQEDHEKLARFLIEISRLPNLNVVNLKICMASRPWNVFRDILGLFDGFSIHDYTQRDIETYATVKLRSVVRTPSTISSLCNTLVRKVCEKAHGSFIWVRLVTDTLYEGQQDGDSEAQLIRQLEAVPEEIEDLYRQILGTLKLQHTHEALALLQIHVCMHADEHRDLPLHEFLNLVAAFCGEQPRWTDSISDPTLHMLDEAKRYVLSRSGGLLEIFVDKAWTIWAAEWQKCSNGLTAEDRARREPTYSDHNLRVQSIHHTVKSYLDKVASWETLLRLSSPIQEHETGNVFLFRHALNYQPEFRGNYTWFYAKQAELQTGKSQIQLLEDNRKVFHEDQALDDANVPSFSVTAIHHLLPSQPQCTLISFAVTANLLFFMKALLESGLNINIEKNGRPLLQYAIGQDFRNFRVQGKFYDSAYERVNMVELLLQHGAKVDAKHNGVTALHLVLHTSGVAHHYLPRLPSQSYDEDIPQYTKELSNLMIPVLLQSEADPNITDGWGYTALGIAIRRYQNSKNEDVNIIRMLLDKNADKNSLGDACDPWIVEVLSRSKYKRLGNSSFKRLKLLETLQGYGSSAYSTESEDEDLLAIAIIGFQGWWDDRSEDESDFLSLLRYIIQHEPSPKIADLRSRAPLHSMLTETMDRIFRHDFVIMLLESGFAVKSMLPYLGPSFDNIVLYGFTDNPRDLARSYRLIRAVLEDGIDPNQRENHYAIHILLDFRLEIFSSTWTTALLKDSRLIAPHSKFYVPMLKDQEIHLWERLFILLLTHRANPNLLNEDSATAWDRVNQLNKTPMTNQPEPIPAKCLKLLRTYSQFPEIRQSKRQRNI
jgi:hypothetical protein